MNYWHVLNGLTLQGRMMELWITLPEDFGERFAKFRQSILGAEDLAVQGALSYDKSSAKLSLGNRYIQIPLSSNQSVLCDALFNLPHGEWLEDVEIHHSYYSESETSMYDAVRAINKAAKSRFGINGLLQFKALKVRIQKEILNQNHSD